MKKREFRLSNRTPIVSLDRELRYAWERIRASLRVFPRLPRCLFGPRSEANLKSGGGHGLDRRLHRRAAVPRPIEDSLSFANPQALAWYPISQRAEASLLSRSRQHHYASERPQISDDGVRPSTAQRRHRRKAPDRAIFPTAFEASRNGAPGKRLRLPHGHGWAA